MPDPSATRFRRLAGVPVVVWAACVAFGALAAVWSVVAPLGEAPDEPAHLSLVLHLADGNPYPDFDGLENQAAIIRLCRTYASATRACPREGEPVTPTSMRLHPIGEAPDKATRPAWDTDGGDRAVGQGNQMPQHPPLYYQAMASVLRVERAVGGGPWSTDRELALLRLVNALLLAPLPLLAWWAATRFRLDRATAVASAAAVFVVPMLSHIGATLNNDNLLTLLGAVLVALLAGVVRGDRSVRTAVAVGVVTGLALLTKAFAAMFPPLIVLAYLIGAVELAPAGWIERLRALVKPVAIAGGVTFVLAGWWYIGVRQRTGRFAPSIESERLTTALRPPGFQADPGVFAGEFVSNLNRRFWGSFGWYTIRFPSALTTTATLVVLAMVGVALVARRDPSDSTRLQRLWLLLPLQALGLFVLLRAWNLHVTTSKFQFIQGRYLFAGIIGLLVLASIGTGRLAGRWAPVATVGLAVVLQGEALRRCLQGWWGGPGLGPRGQLKALVAWSGWPGEALALLAVVALAAGAWFLWELVRELRSPAEAPVASVAT